MKILEIGAGVAGNGYGGVLALVANDGNRPDFPGKKASLENSFPIHSLE